MYTKPHKTNLNTNDDDDLDLVQYVKDHFGLSNAAYQELSMVSDKPPRLWKLKHLAHEIKPYTGAQQSLYFKLKA